MDLKIKILKFLNENKDNENYVDLLIFLKSMNSSPKEISSVISRIKKDDLASIVIKPQNLGWIIKRGNLSNIIQLSDIRIIKGKINYKGEEYLQSLVSANINPINSVIKKYLLDITIGVIIVLIGSLIIWLISHFFKHLL